MPEGTQQEIFKIKFALDATDNLAKSKNFSEPQCHNGGCGLAAPLHTLARLPPLPRRRPSRLARHLHRSPVKHRVRLGSGLRRSMWGWAPWGAPAPQTPRVWGAASLSIDKFSSQNLIWGVQAASSLRETRELRRGGKALPLN